MGALGFLGVFISVIFFGSNFVPLKRLKIGDGVFFQFIMCNGIFVASIPVLMIQGFPEFHGLAIFGGFLWCTGNMLCPITIRLIGMGMGLLIWGTVSMIFGWASGTFGLFGLKKQEIADFGLNVAGVVIVLVGLAVFLQVKTNDTSVDNIQKGGYENLKEQGDDLNVTEIRLDTPLVDNEAGTPRSANETLAKEEDEDDFFVGWSENSKRITGVLCAAVAGIFFGCNFDPAQYVIDNSFDGEDNSLNYVFPQFTGILLTSWCYTILYCIYKWYQGQKPYIPNDVLLPASISGIMWGIADIAWFFANGELGFAITFPIISSGPGFVGSLWGIFLFKEITGKRNFMILGVAALITIAALIMIALSH
jgi:glucose uptake protein GlcU